MKKITGILLITVLALSCVSAPPPSAKPAWVDNKHIEYAESEFMVEIGQGASLKDAKRNGAAALAQIFKTSIKVESTIRTRYKEISTEGAVQTSEETDYDENITQLADQELINVNYGESWTNDLGQVHVIAYIDRQDTAQIYRRRIMENSDTVLSLLKRSADQESRILKYAFLDAAYVVASANQELKEQLEIINLPMSRTIMLSYNLDDIRNDRRETARDMTFRINIQDDDEGKIAAFLSDQLSSMGFSPDQSGNLSVTGSVRFEKVELDNKYENLKYYLMINISDEEGVPVVALEENDRVSAVSLSDARSRSYIEIEKVIKKDLMNQFTAYLDGFVK